MNKIKCTEQKIKRKKQDGKCGILGLLIYLSLRTWPQDENAEVHHMMLLVQNVSTKTTVMLSYGEQERNNDQ